MIRPLILTVLCILSALTGSAAERPMNIVLLYADDWRHDTLGAAGHPIVKTPNLDQLAREGVRFRNSYVTTAICGVSRATLLTGQWMSRHGNPAFAMFRTPWRETYPGLLRTNGYSVAHVGKWHNGRFPSEQFDFGRSYMGTHWITNQNGEAIHVTQKNENDALEFLRTRPIEKPFCLTVSFFATHAQDNHPDQFLPQPASMRLYESVKVPVPANMTDESFRRLPPFIAHERNEGRVRWHWRFDAPEKYQRMMRNYYRLATEVDSVCGRVIEELRRQNLLESTLVIFTTDNGYYHGEHGLADKWYPHEESIRVPLIIRDPRLPQSRRGQTNDSMVLNVDLAPTLLFAANVPPTPRMQGKNLAPLYLEGAPALREEFFYEHATIRSTNFIPSSEALVRKDWKYFYWPDFKAEQLFHLPSDPREENDLASNPAHETQLAEMRRRFAELKAAAQ